MMKKVKKLCLYGILGFTSVLSLNAQIVDGLVASYTFTSITGTTVPDVTGNGYTGTIVGSIPNVQGWDGNVKGAVSFNGINTNYIVVNSSPGLNITSAISICAWVKTTDTDGRIVDKATVGTTDTYNMDIFNDYRFVGGNNSVNLVTTVPGSGSWQFIVSTYDGNTRKIYVNSILSASDNANLTALGTNFQNLYLGVNTQHNTMDVLTGLIDDVKIYNKALNQCEINQLYAGTLPALPITPSTIIGPNSSVCNNSSYTFSITSLAGTTYKWSAGTGSPSPQTGGSAIFTWTGPTTDIITVTPYNSCSIAGTSTTLGVTISGNNVPVLTTITGPTSLCISTTGIYTTNLLSGATYDWELVSGSTTTSGGSFYPGPAAGFQFLTAGVNYIKVRASNSCGFGNYITLPVTVNSGLTNFSISGPNPVCPNSTEAYSVTGVTPSGSYNFTWAAYGNPVYQLNLDPGVIVNQITFPSGSTGTVYVSVTGIGTCGNLSIVYPIAINSAPITPVLTCIAGGIACTILGVTNYTVAGIGISWMYNSTTLTGVTTITRPSDTQVSVTYTNSVTGCSSRNYYFPSPCSSFGLRIDESETSFAVNAPNEAFKLYPNPNDGNLTFETDGTKGEAFVIDILGRIVSTIQLNENQFAYSLDIPAKSTYVLRIRTEKANKNIKFIVK